MITLGGGLEGKIPDLKNIPNRQASSALMEKLTESGVDCCLFTFGHASLGKRIFIRLSRENILNKLLVFIL